MTEGVSYWKPNVNEIIAGEADPYLLAVYDHESDSYYFAGDWKPYDLNDLDRIYAEWLEKNSGKQK